MGFYPRTEDGHRHQYAVYLYLELKKNAQLSLVRGWKVKEDTATRGADIPADPITRVYMFKKTVNPKAQAEPRTFKIFGGRL